MDTAYVTTDQTTELTVTLVREFQCEVGALRSE